MISYNTTTKENKMTTKNLVIKGTPFSIKAMLFINKNAGKLSALSMAKRLRRTEKSIRRKAEKLGISLRVNK